MDDYATYLAEEARAEIVVLHQFRILYDEKRHAHHFFFEGEEDALFYMPLARRHKDVIELHPYDCGGKKNVVDVRDAIKAGGYNIEKCLFFVDRDFDDLLCSQISADDHTYITDGYSIENDISTVSSANIILSEIIGLSRTDPEFNHIENSLKKGFKEFYQEIRPLTAWILAAKYAGCGPNLNNTQGLKGIITFHNRRPILTKEGFAEFKKKVTVSNRTPPLAFIIARRRILNSISPKLWARGKYTIWFFQTFLIDILKETNVKRKAAGAKALRIPNSLREGRIFELMGGRNTPPQSLKCFLESKLLSN